MTVLFSGRIARMTRAAPPRPVLLEDLEHRHDGTPPAGAVRMALLGGRGQAEVLAHAATLRHHTRLAADARLGAARRRARVPADQAPGDAWLNRLAAALAHHRHAAVMTPSVMTPPMGSSPLSPASGPSRPCAAPLRS